jgi:hypothetical protein
VESGGKRTRPGRVRWGAGSGVKRAVPYRTVPYRPVPYRTAQQTTRSTDQPPVVCLPAGHGTTGNPPPNASANIATRTLGSLVPAGLRPGRRWLSVGFDAHRVLVDGARVADEKRFDIDDGGRQTSLARFSGSFSRAYLYVGGEERAMRPRKVAGRLAAEKTSGTYGVQTENLVDTVGDYSNIESTCQCCVMRMSSQ